MIQTFFFFSAHAVLQGTQLNDQTKFALNKVSTDSLTAGMLKGNFKEKVKQFIARDNAYSFMRSIKGTPAYWRKFLHEVMTMVKQLGIPTFFFTLSSADLRWNELIYIISNLSETNISEDEINKLIYQERCKILNSNPVLVAQHFQYRVEVFFKEIVLDGPLGKTKCYAIRVEFQAKGKSPYSFIYLDFKCTTFDKRDQK